MNHFKRLAWTILFSVMFGFPALAANAKVGEPPPLLLATELLQAPPGAKMDADSLRGKVVIVEFWATWRGPCIAAIPHLNELAENQRSADSFVRVFFCAASPRLADKSVRAPERVS